MANAIHIDSSGVRNFSQVHTAAAMANELLGNIEFYYRIALHNSFDLADVPPETIAELIGNTTIEMSFNLYRANSPIKNYDGYDDPENPSLIHLNIWKIDRSPASICNTIIHSCIHAVNAHHNQYYFGHGDISLHGKENTAPYWIGALAQQIVSKDDTMILPLEHDRYVPHKELQKILYNH